MLYKQERSLKIKFQENLVNSITSEEADSLEVLPMKYEIKEVV